MSVNKDRPKAVILSAVRTPIGSFRGVLASKSAIELGALTIARAVKDSGLESNSIDEVIMGCVLQSGLGQSPARQAALLAGIPEHVDCFTVNKVCASSLKAVTIAVQSIKCGNSNAIVAGGMESLSNSPFFLPRNGIKYGGEMIIDSITNDGLMCPTNKIHMGLCTENLAKKYDISRTAQDNYAVESYKRAAAAWENKKFQSEIVPVSVVDAAKKATLNVTEDEEYKKAIFEKFPTLRPAFDANGTITAANASKLNDGASSLVIADSSFASKHNCNIIAEIIGFADTAVAPIDFGIAPAFSIRKALKNSEIQIEDVSLFEINEAFSVVPLACIKELNLDPSLVNIHGGAVSLGHPLGASGARILTHLVHSLEKSKIGVAAICNGGGGSTAVIVRRV